jgi:hypothetical protein
VIVTDLIKRSINRLKHPGDLKIPYGLSESEYSVVMKYLSPADLKSEETAHVSFSNPLWLRHELQICQLAELKGNTALPPKILALLRLEVGHHWQTADVV